MPRIWVTKRDKELVSVEGDVGRKLMEILRDADMDVEAICGGSCSCATCHVFIAPEWVEKLGPRNPDEEELLEQASAYDPTRSRLLCQIEFTGDLAEIRVEIAPVEEII